VPSAVSKNLGATDYVTTDDTRDGTGVARRRTTATCSASVAGAAVAVTQNIAAARRVRAGLK
jgi:hypothetical protein